MKITVVTSKKFYYERGIYKTTGGFGKIMEYIATLFDKVILCVPVEKGEQFNGFKMTSKNISYILLPPYELGLDFLIKLPVILIKIFKAVRQGDIVNVRVPSYESFFSFAFAKLLNKPIYTYMGGDWEWASYYGKYKNHRILTKFFALFNKTLTKIVLYHSTSFLMGHDIYNKYYKKGKQIYLTSNSTLLESDIIGYNDTCQNKEIKLLFVGRLSSEKRIYSLIDATKLLNNKGYKCRLIIVGDGPERKNLIDTIEKLDNFVELKGYVPLGEKLYSIYQESDIFVFPSDENTIAKVVLEAMARGLPIVVSNCGAMPMELENNKNALLINPGDVHQIVQAVETIINNSELRQAMIKNNLRAVKDYTLDKILNERMGILKKSNKRLEVMFQ